MTATITVLYPAMAIHRHGCTDATRALAEGYDRGTRTNVESSQDFTAESVEAAIALAVEDINDAGDWDNPWQASDFYQYPCLTTEPKPAKPVPADRCPGSGQPFAVKVGRMTSMGFARAMYAPCPVCGRSYGTGRGVLPTHKAPAPKVEKPKCGKCGDTTNHRSGFCSTCREMARLGYPGYENVTAK